MNVCLNNWLSEQQNFSWLLLKKRYKPKQKSPLDEWFYISRFPIREEISSERCPLLRGLWPTVRFLIPIGLWFPKQVALLLGQFLPIWWVLASRGSSAHHRDWHLTGQYLEKLLSLEKLLILIKRENCEYIRGGNPQTVIWYSESRARDHLPLKSHVPRIMRIVGQGL